MNSEPPTTQIMAGSQPQITAMAGPSIGDKPVIEAKWWPKRTPRGAGT